MIRIEIEPVWRFKRDGDPKSHLLMLNLLNEIRMTGKISRAADHQGLSYRHAWNLIEKWSAFFEVPLVERKRGSGTSLTAFGAKLVWAGQRLEARLRDSDHIPDLVHQQAHGAVVRPDYDVDRQSIGRAVRHAKPPA